MYQDGNESGTQSNQKRKLRNHAKGLLCGASRTLHYKSQCDSLTRQDRIGNEILFQLKPFQLDI